MKTSGISGLQAGIVLAAALATPAGLGGIPPQGASEPYPRNEQLRTAVSKEQLAAALDPLIQRLMKDGDVPGLSLAVVKDGRVLYHGAFGVKDSGSGAPVGNDTIFERRLFPNLSLHTRSRSSSTRGNSTWTPPSRSTSRGTMSMTRDFA